MKLGEFFVQLGVNAETKTLKEFVGTIAELPLDAVTAVAALAGIEYELGKVAEKAIESALGFQMFASQTGLSWQQLQQWQIVAERANVSTESVTSSVMALESHLGQLRMGYGNTRPFAMFGVDISQNAFGVLGQLRGLIGKYPRSVSRNLLQEMGIGPDLMQLLLLSDRAWKEYTEHVHGMTARQQEDFLKAKLALTGFGQTFRYEMTAMVSHFVEAIEKSMVFKDILIGLGIAAAAVAAYFFPITAAVIGLMLVLDDLAVYFTGGDSVIGSVIEGLKKMGKTLADSFKGFDNLAKLMSLALIGLPGGAVAAATTLAAQTSQTVNQTNNITVHSTGGADETAKAIKEQLRRSHGTAEAQFKKAAR